MRKKIYKKKSKTNISKKMKMNSIFSSKKKIVIISIGIVIIFVICAVVLGLIALYLGK